MEKISLPQDLVEEILSRVPAKSLSRFRSTSKQYNALLKSTSFAKKHSTNAPKEPLIIMLTNSRVYLMKLDLHAIQNNSVAPSVNLGAQLYIEDPLSSASQVDVRNVSHCDGLLLCATEDNRLVVLNPCSGETTWIKPRDSYEKTDCYVLGYDKSKKYKILRMDSHPPHECEIYDSTSDSWRVLGSADWSLLPHEHHGVSMKGNSYWVAFNSQEKHRFLLCFDFSIERFQSLSLPHPFSHMLPGISVVGEEKFFLLVIDFLEDANSKKLQLWILRNSTGSVMPWSKFLTMGYWFFHGESFLVDEQNKVVVFCQKYSHYDKALHIVGEDQDIRVDHNGGVFSHLHYYVPSLAQFQHGGGRKRNAPEVEQERDL